MMDHPLKTVRERLGLTIADMAATLGLRYSAYYNAEKGLTALPSHAHEPLKELGYDVGALADQQVRWMNERGAELRQRILTKTMP
jgi:DNA-binding XRE family transcriptional regulator